MVGKGLRGTGWLLVFRSAVTPPKGGAQFVAMPQTCSAGNAMCALRHPVRFASTPLARGETFGYPLTAPY